jgi:membrane fusion protein, multidrug efflux system
MSEPTTVKGQAKSEPDIAQMGEARPEGIGAKMSKRRLTVGILAIIVILASICAQMAHNYYAIRESTDDAQVDGHINPVSARVGGTVVDVPVTDNQPVAAGAILVQLDPTDYRIALQRAEADLAEAEAAAKGARGEVPVTSVTTASRVSAALAGLTQAQDATIVAARDVETARARLALAQAREREMIAQLNRTSKDLERMKLLIAKDEISRQEYDAAVAAADTAQAARESAQAAITQSEKEVDSAAARLTQARGGVEAAQAAVDAAGTAPLQTEIVRNRATSAAAKVEISRAALNQARLNLEYTTVKAPVAGIVSKKNAEIGQVVQPGQSLLAVVPLDDIWVTANFKENQLLNVRLGQQAIVLVDAYGSKEYRGHIESIAAATGSRFSLLPPENATGNYVKVVQRIPLKIVLERGEDSEHVLRPGMSVVVTVMLK